MKQIIGIDPGASNGAIAWRIKTTQVAKSPKDLKELTAFLKQRKQEENDLIVFIEKLAIRPGDEANKGKLFRMQKMKTNYDQLIATLIHLDIPFIEVMPSYWQKSVGVEKIKGEEYKDRKQRLKEKAIQLFPQKKVTLWNCDALLIMYFGVKKLEYDPEYVWSKIEKQSDLKKLF